MTTGNARNRWSARIWRNTSRPSTRGILRSRSTTAGCGPPPPRHSARRGGRGSRAPRRRRRPLYLVGEVQACAARESVSSTSLGLSSARRIPGRKASRRWVHAGGWVDGQGEKMAALPPTRALGQVRPPWRPTMRRTLARPMPVPSELGWVYAAAGIRSKSLAAIGHVEADSVRRADEHLLGGIGASGLKANGDGGLRVLAGVFHGVFIRVDPHLSQQRGIGLHGRQGSDVPRDGAAILPVVAFANNRRDERVLIDAGEPQRRPAHAGEAEQIVDQPSHCSAAPEIVAR